MNSRRQMGLLAAFALLTACAGEGPDSGARASQEDASTPKVTAAPAGESAPTGEIDQDLASSGESLFQSKGCLACHTVGRGRLTGPDLQGVTERREYGWMIAMMTNPDSMVKEDPVAKQLFAEYMTPMLNLGVTTGDARAIYEYLRREQ